MQFRRLAMYVQISYILLIVTKADHRLLKYQLKARPIVSP